MIESPSSYNNMGFFQIMVVVYTMFGVALRQKIPEQDWRFSFMCIHYYLYVFPGVFVVFGLWSLSLIDMFPIKYVVYPVLPFYLVAVFVLGEWLQKQYQ